MRLSPKNERFPEAAAPGRSTVPWGDGGHLLSAGRRDRPHSSAAARKTSRNICQTGMLGMGSYLVVFHTSGAFTRNINSVNSSRAGRFARE